MYVDYKYYTQTFKEGIEPTISLTSFNFLVKKAENYLNLRTLGSYKDVTDETSINQIKDCLCALVESYNDDEQSVVGGMVKASESVGGHSISYATGQTTSYSSRNRKDDIIKLYLWHLGLIKSRKVFGLHEG